MSKLYSILFLFLFLFSNAYSKDLVCEVTGVEMYNGEAYVDELESSPFYSSTIKEFIIRDFDSYYAKKTDFYNVEVYRKGELEAGKLKMSNTKFVRALSDSKCPQNCPPDMNRLPYAIDIYDYLYRLRIQNLIVFSRDKASNVEFGIDLHTDNTFFYVYKTTSFNPQKQEDKASREITLEVGEGMCHFTHY